MICCWAGISLTVCNWLVWCIATMPVLLRINLAVSISVDLQVGNSMADIGILNSKSLSCLPHKWLTCILITYLDSESLGSYKYMYIVCKCKRWMLTLIVFLANHWVSYKILHRFIYVLNELNVPFVGTTMLSRHSLSSVQLASMAHCCYASAPVVVRYSGNRLTTTCGTTPYLGVN